MLQTESKMPSALGSRAIDGRRIACEVSRRSTSTKTTSLLGLPRRASGIARPAAPAPSKPLRASPASSPRSSVAAAASLRNVDQPQALLFDCDGVLLESEAVGHRNSFNAAFKEEEALRPDEHEW